MGVARAIGLLLGAAADGVIGKPRRPARVTLAALVAGTVTALAGRRSLVAQAAGTAMATWAVLGAAELAADGTVLARGLQDGDLAAARGALARWDPRVSDGLDVRALSRASVETVAENTADAVVTPLLWGAVAGTPGLVAVKAMAFLRATSGRRPSGHRRAIAAVDDVVRLVPTRLAAALTVAGAPIVGGSSGAAWRAWRRDTIAHPSLNAGRIEAAFAGALEVRLGGRTVFAEGVENLPVLGDGRNPDAGHVTRAVELSRVVGWLAWAGAVLVAALTGRRRRQ